MRPRQPLRQRQQTAGLSSPPLLGLAALFLLAPGWWVANVWRHPWRIGLRLGKPILHGQAGLVTAGRLPA